MWADFFIQGLMVGFSVAAPVGPIGILCIRKTLAEGRLAGFFTGLGAALADSIYGAMAGFSLKSITYFLMEGEQWLKLAGGFFLLYLGIKTFFSKPPEASATVNTKKRWLANFFTTFLLTITNPATIFSFLAIFSGLGLAEIQTDNTGATMLVAGVFTGSAAWWLILTTITGSFRHIIKTKVMRWINRISGVIILSFACWSLITAIECL